MASGCLRGTWRAPNGPGTVVCPFRVLQGSVGRDPAELRSFHVLVVASGETGRAVEMSEPHRLEVGGLPEGGAPAGGWLPTGIIARHLVCLRGGRPMRPRLGLVLAALVLGVAACSGGGGSEGVRVLRLATTTSTADSGLLDALLPAFEARYGARVDVVAVGTGQAIEIGRAADADVILVHARAREEAFVAEGYGAARYEVMHNDYVVVGPVHDPAGIRGLPIAAEALATISATEATFASRGDDSGTHTREEALWAAAGIAPDPAWPWYKSLGQGMGATLNFAQEVGAYALTDRGTFLFQQASLPGLEVMVGGDSIAENIDPALLNPYGVIPVSPDTGSVDEELARLFVEWLISPDAQGRIGSYGVDTFGQPLFYPDSELWRDQ